AAAADRDERDHVPPGAGPPLAAAAAAAALPAAAARGSNCPVPRRRRAPRIRSLRRPQWQPTILLSSPSSCSGSPPRRVAAACGGRYPSCHEPCLSESAQIRQITAVRAPLRCHPRVHRGGHAFAGRGSCTVADAVRRRSPTLRSMTSATLRRILLVALAAGTTAWAGRSIGPFGTVYDDTREPTRAESKQRELEEAMRRARAAVPARPDLVQPGSTEATKVWKAALNGSGIRILVGTESRSLWLMKDTTVLFRAPVAVGMEEGFTYKGRKYDFKTPVGRRRVIAKARDPIWVPPDWHYFELAVQRNLEVRSEEHTSELQSREKLVCRLLLDENKPIAQP